MSDGNEDDPTGGQARLSVELAERIGGQARSSVELAERIGREMLAGCPAWQIGAALGQLLARWLAGHVVPDDDGAASATLRDELLADHVELVLRLLPLEVAALPVRDRGLPDEDGDWDDPGWERRLPVVQ